MSIPEEFCWEGELRSRGQLETNEGMEFVSWFLACFSIRPVVVALTLAAYRKHTYPQYPHQSRIVDFRVIFKSGLHDFRGLQQGMEMSFGLETKVSSERYVA